VKSHIPAVHEGVALATPAQLRHRLPQAVMVSAGTQLPPHELVFAGQVQRLREVSQICPFPQFEFVWQPKTHWLLRGSQKWLGGHEPAVWVHVAGNC
jgi:hypothetical protein